MVFYYRSENNWIDEKKNNFHEHISSPILDIRPILLFIRYTPVIALYASRIAQKIISLIGHNSLLYKI